MPPPRWCFSRKEGQRILLEERKPCASKRRYAFEVGEVFEDLARCSGGTYRRMRAAGRWVQRINDVPHLRVAGDVRMP